MARWFRSYVDKLDNAKVQSLSDAHYRAWDSLLCVACKYDGLLPPLRVIAFQLRRSQPVTAKLIEALVRAGLLVKTERGIEPHDWNTWQYKSDVSTGRVKQHRERRQNATRNVSATHSESDADTEQSSEAKASDAPDVASLIFGRGREWLQRSTGKPDSACRSLLGKWRKIAGDEGLIAVLGRAQREAPIDAVAWIERALQATGSAKTTGWN